LLLNTFRPAVIFFALSQARTARAARLNDQDKAAEQGQAKAQFNLGIAYASGRGVKKYYAEAVKWWRKAADQGGADAQFNLGIANAQDQGSKKDYAEANKWFRKAAEQGFANAQFHVSNAYTKGRGVK